MLRWRRRLASNGIPGGATQAGDAVERPTDGPAGSALSLSPRSTRASMLAGHDAGVVGPTGLVRHRPFAPLSAAARPGISSLRPLGRG
jgi:hypothetical protein